MTERYLDKVAVRLLARHGLSIIWDLHVRAAFHYRHGHLAAAVLMIGIADAVEEQSLRVARKAG